MAEAEVETSACEPQQQDGAGGAVRGYIDGCFDIMHSGHFNAIRQAKCLCDVLVVGVHSDPEIEENKALPVMKEPERYALLKHVKWIDEIVYDVPYSPQLATLELARADFCVHGDDMPVNSAGVCAYDEMRLAGKLKIVKRTEGVSTTDLIGRLLTLSRQHQSVDKDSDIVGVRVSAEDAIEHLSVDRGSPCSPTRSPFSSTLMAQAGAMGFLGPPIQPLLMADELAAKYGMSSADLESLKASIQECCLPRMPADRLPVPALPQPSSAVTPAKDKPNNADDQMRAQAPVQLLASTRRLAEFASSRCPGEGDKVVYVNGAFDMFHVGHAEFLKDARELGTFLLVGIHEDLTVSRAKGPSFPVMNLTERVLNVCACKWVDEVIIGAPRGVTEDLIKTWDIHIVARGCGHMRNEGDEQDATRYEVAAKANVYTEVMSKWPELCHDTIVKRIMASRQVYLQRNKDRAKREDLYYEQKSAKNQPKEAVT